MGCFLKSFADLQHKPLLVDLTVEEGQRLKVIFGSHTGFHVIDVDSGNSYDIYIPSHVSSWEPAVQVLCTTTCMRKEICSCKFLAEVLLIFTNRLSTWTFSLH